MKRPRHHQHRDTKEKVSEVKLYMKAENAVDGCLAEGLELQTRSCPEENSPLDETLNM